MKAGVGFFRLRTSIVPGLYLALTVHSFVEYSQTFIHENMLEKLGLLRQSFVAAPGRRHVDDVLEEAGKNC